MGAVTREVLSPHSQPVSTGFSRRGVSGQLLRSSLHSQNSNSQNVRPMQPNIDRLMCRVVFLLLIPVVALALTGCYSAKITTDKQPSGQVIEKPWATGFVAGLATPGAQIDAAQQCPNGVAMVETEVSFLNQVATAFTFNLYSPMSVTVTCAAGGSMSSLMPAPDFEMPSEVDEVEVAETLHAAALKSAKTNEAVRVQVK